MTDTVFDGIDYGPLYLLPGTWKGEKGMDVAPESDGSIEENPFNEEILFEAIGNATNAGKQNLAVVRYHQKVYRRSNNTQFHDQLGYWIWDAAANTVMQTISIPRAVTLVAGGSFDPATIKNDSALLVLKSKDGGDWGVAQLPYHAKQIA